jgi:HD-GYP domain-containing protein (c-di-GMP phosphodiesterase class II)
MRDIVPGVLCHHERVDGKGYPNGLSGEQIPIIGKIIGLADCFDAMTSKRTYRQAMTIEKALSEIRDGMGTQFDEQIAKVFLNSDINRLWEIIYSNGSGLYPNNDSIDYGSVAVETLLK